MWFGGVRPTIFLGFDMAVEVFKDGVSYYVEPHDLHNHLQAGYTLELVTNEPKAPQLDIDKARAAYLEKFGEEPHHKMKLETILEKINGD